MLRTRLNSMMSILGLALTILVLIACGGQSNQKNTAQMQKGVTVPQNKIVLWNGKDFSNWVFVLEDSTVDPMDVWSVRDGVIHCAGDPMGYMRTKNKYANYALHVEWRWPEVKSNSGVFLFMNGPDKVWPDTLVECQLQAGNAGDLVSFPGLKIRALEGKNSRVVPKQSASNERPVGEWNSYDIRSDGDTLTVNVNGKLQNKVVGFSVASGSIGLQGEGNDVEFRNVYVEPL